MEYRFPDPGHILSYVTINTRVFVVDDDLSARRGIARLLRAAGHETCDFASAAEFLGAFEPGTGGCLVLDARMPGMSGEELQLELEARGAHLPIIIITGDDEPETRRKARSMHAEGFFRKPVDGTALLDAIAWAMRPKDASNHSH